MPHIKPLRSGEPGRAFFAAYHAPEGSRRETALLICNPFGADALVAHRMLRVLAEQVARDGRPTLRFDYRNTGDSDGHCEDADAGNWQRDIVAADELLRFHSGCVEVAWLGLGLGANLALAAATMAPRAPTRIFMWDPVTSRDEFLEATDQSVKLEPALTQPGLFRLEAGTREVGSFPIAARLREQLADLALDRIQRPPGAALAWLTSQEDAIPTSLKSPADTVVMVPAWAARLRDYPSALMVPRNVLDALRPQLSSLP
jgi:pimeloyl-ACP methyl ester carboxylesterase